MMRDNHLYPKPQSRYLSKKVLPMTICIGVICDDEKKAIAVADRMVTEEEYLAVKFEHLIPKIQILCDNCVAMIAGDALEPWEYLKQIKSRIGGKTRLPISEILEYAKEEFVKLRNKRVNENIFFKRELTLTKFYENQANLNSELVATLDQMVDECVLGLWVLIVGVDDDGAQIHYVVDPGTSKSFNNLGYVSTGIGARHSDITFVDSRYTSMCSFKQSLYLAYKAKRRAESAPGVGSEFTDIIVIDKKCRTVSEATIDKLGQIYEKEIRLGKSEQIAESVDKLEVEYTKSE